MRVTRDVYSCLRDAHGKDKFEEALTGNMNSRSYDCVWRVS